MQSEKAEIRAEQTGAIDKLGAAIELALTQAPVSEVLSVLTGAFVGLTVELVRRQGHDVSKEIKVDGGVQRDITIHAPKEPAHGWPHHASAIMPERDCTRLSEQPISGKVE